ncbi:MAG: CerR family C-terminal domain-containing protein [Rubripirellula sp.]
MTTFSWRSALEPRANLSNAHSKSGSETRARILDAAGPVFAAHGFEGATVREICSSAGVNIASVGYYFGDKLGLYRDVIQQIRDTRERQFPAPHHVPSDPRLSLHQVVRTIISRILACDESGWESQVLMREMQSPTPVFESIVQEFFRPLFDQLVHALEKLIGQPTPKHTLEQLALSVVGQCVYYKFGAGVVQILIPEAERQAHYDIDSLSLHITAVMLAAVDNASVLKQRLEIERLNQVPSPSSSHD